MGELVALPFEILEATAVEGTLGMSRAIHSTEALPPGLLSSAHSYRILHAAQWWPWLLEAASQGFPCYMDHSTASLWDVCTYSHISNLWVKTTVFPSALLAS